MRRWLLALLLLSVLGMGLTASRGRWWMSDLAVYRTAAERFVAGAPLCEPTTVFYRYKYAPTAALYFAPLVVVPEAVGKILVWIVVTLAAGGALFLALRLVPPEVRAPDDRPLLVLAVAVTVLGTHIQRELHLGQVNQLLAFSFVAALALLHARHDAAAGAVLAASLFVKPFALVFLPLLVLQRRWRATLVLVASVAALALLPLAFYGTDGLATAYAGWADELRIELAWKGHLSEPARHTIFSITSRALDSSASPLTVKLAVLTIIGLAFLWLFRPWTRAPEGRIDPLAWAVLMAFIPLFACTEYNAYLFAQAAVVVLVAGLRRLTLPARVTAIVGLTLIGICAPDLLRRGAWDIYHGRSLIAYGGTLVVLAVGLLRAQLHDRGPGALQPRHAVDV